MGLSFIENKKDQIIAASYLGRAMLFHRAEEEDLSHPSWLPSQRVQHKDGAGARRGSEYTVATVNIGHGNRVDDAKRLLGKIRDETPDLAVLSVTESPSLEREPYGEIYESLFPEFYGTWAPDVTHHVDPAYPCGSVQGTGNWLFTSFPHESRVLDLTACWQWLTDGHVRRNAIVGTADEMSFVASHLEIYTGIGTRGKQMREILGELSPKALFAGDGNTFFGEYESAVKLLAQQGYEGRRVNNLDRIVGKGVELGDVRTIEGIEEIHPAIICGVYE